MSTTAQNMSKRTMHARKRLGFLAITSILFAFIGYLNINAMNIIRQTNLKGLDESILDYLIHLEMLSPFVNTTANKMNLSSSHQEILPEPPPLKEVIDEQGQGWNVIKDVRWLIDFSIIGFAKTGTTTLLHYLKTDDIWTTETEKCDLGWNRPAPLIRYFYQNAPIFNATNDKNNRIFRGMKCPTDIESRQLSLTHYGMHFNKTKFILGVRHPVRWFESLYNFRLSFHTHGRGKKVVMKPTAKLIGGCSAGTYGVCTERARFDIAMAKLGKTLLTDEEKQVMNLNPNQRIQWKQFLNEQQKYDPLPNKVFLYDVEQLADLNETRSYLFRNDLRNYIGSKTEFSPMIKISTQGRKRNVTKINICDKEHKDVRSELVDIGAKASRWISDYFIKSPDVIISSPEFFLASIKSWGTDPCT